MTACTLLNRTWKTQFALTASTFIHIPRLSYLLYLAKIVRTDKSTIYNKWDLQHRAQTITCFLDLTDSEKGPPYRGWDEKTSRIYEIFTFMGNYIGLRMCFPSVQRLHLETLLYPVHWIPDLTHPAKGRHGPFVLTWTRIAIIFDEEPRKTPLSVLKKVPLVLSAYRTQFNIETVLRGPLPSALESEYSKHLLYEMSFYMPRLISIITLGLCPPSWSYRCAAIHRPDISAEFFPQTDDDIDIAEKLLRNRTKHNTGVGLSLQCDTILKEHWEREDVMDVKIQLYRAGRKSVLGPSPIVLSSPC